MREREGEKKSEREEKKPLTPRTERERLDNLLVSNPLRIGVHSSWRAK